MERAERRANLSGLTAAAQNRILSWPDPGRKTALLQAAKSLAKGKKPVFPDRFSWPNALLGEGLLAVRERDGSPKALSAVETYLARWKSAGFPIRYVDNLMNGTLALRIQGSAPGDFGERQNPGGPRGARPGQECPGKEELRREHQNPRGPYPVSADLYRLCREAADACAAWAKGAPRTAAGILAYRAQHPDWIFADAAGMVSPFLCRYGAQEGERELTDLGTKQLLRFLENGMDARTGLPYHGYDEQTGTKYGIIGWGRACGWLLKGLSESLPWLSGAADFAPGRAGSENAGAKQAGSENAGAKQTGSGRAAGLRDAFEALTDAVLEWQRPDGGFSWQLQALDGPRDSSVDGMIGTALAKGLAEGLYGEERAARVRRALSALAEGLEAWAKAGQVGGCSGECMGFSEYPQTYGVYPWGTGTVLEFLAMTDGEIEWEE